MKKRIYSDSKEFARGFNIGKEFDPCEKMIKEAIELCIECCVEEKLHSVKRENRVLASC